MKGEIKDDEVIYDLHHSDTLYYLIQDGSEKQCADAEQKNK
jgi:hypothetical protein